MNWLLIGVGIVFLICMIVGYVRGFVKIVVSLAATIGTIVLVMMLVPHVSGVIAKFTPIDEMVQKKCMSVMMDGIEAELPRQKQIEFLEEVDVPEFFRQGLIANNNSEVYSRLKVTSFQEYVGAYLADMIIRMVAFLLTFIIVTILVRAVIFALDIITALPVIKGLNRFAGIIIGMMIAMIIVWVGFVVITLSYETSIGRECFAWIRESELLTFLYDRNIILEFATKL